MTRFGEIGPEHIQLLLQGLDCHEGAAIYRLGM